MLAKENRVTSAGDFRRAFRKGRRTNTGHAILHVTNNEGSITRVGFVVTKVVGNAVTRNLVRRRLQEITAEVITEYPTGSDVVIRVLAGAEDMTWDALRSEVVTPLTRALKKN